MAADTATQVASILREVLSLHPDRKIDTVARETVSSWDSLAHVSIVLALESEFGISIDLSDQLSLTSYRAIVEHLRGLNR
jgi:acyl carrier protein